MDTLTPPASPELFQTSLMSALVAGDYEGRMTYAELRQRGDFGLGTFNDLDGEMVGFDGVFYQLRADGTARPVSPDQRTPFAVVTFFRAEHEFRLPAGATKDDVAAAVTAAAAVNLFTAVRVDGTFAEVRTRTVRRQARPYPPLVDAAHGQAERRFADVRGTLAGFRSPPYAQGLSVAGCHLHFLRDDRMAGGHALNYRVAEATVRLCALHTLRIELPTTDSFLHADLAGAAVADQITAAEE